jgi:pimeloyl-ACP methyl ester carboxylesterase
MQHNGGQYVMHRLIRYMQERRDNYDRWVGVLADSPAPLRFYAGALDPVSGQHMAEAFLALGPKNNGGILQGIGHYPQTEAPDAVLADYAAFRARILEAKV